MLRFQAVTGNVLKVVERFGTWKLWHTHFYLQLTLTNIAHRELETSISRIYRGKRPVQRGKQGGHEYRQGKEAPKRRTLFADNKHEYSLEKEAA